MVVGHGATLGWNCDHTSGRDNCGPDGLGRSPPMVITEIEKILQRWTDPESIRLHAGEISPSVMMDILVVTNGMAREIRKEILRT